MKKGRLNDGDLSGLSGIARASSVAIPQIRKRAQVEGIKGDIATVPTSPTEATALGSALTTQSYRDIVVNFVRRSNARMRELYGDIIADLENPSIGSAELAAKLILAYIDRDENDKDWYKKAGEVTTGEGKLIVYTCHTGSLAHAGRAFMVAAKLKELGADVVFVVDTDTKGSPPTQRKYVSLIRDAGFDVYHVPTLHENIILEHAQNRASWGFYTVDKIEEESRNQITALQKIEADRGRKPDVIVSDFSPVMSISAEAMDILYVSVLDYTWTNNSRRKLTPPEAHRITNISHSLRLGWLANFLSDKLWATNMFYRVYLILWSIPYNIVRLRMGLKLVRNYYSQTQGDLILMPDYATLKGMRISSDALPISPLVWEPSEDDILAQVSVTETTIIERFEEFLKSDTDKPLIYLTMGSSGILELFKMIIEALQDKPYRIAITTGAQFDISSLGELPDNIFAIPLYSGGKLLERASLMINHGGSGTIYQAIKYGVPQLAIPTHAVQQWNGNMLEEEGIGRMLLRRDLTRDKIAKEVDALLNRHVTEHNGYGITSIRRGR